MTSPSSSAASGTAKDKNMAELNNLLNTTIALINGLDEPLTDVFESNTENLDDKWTLSLNPADRDEKLDVFSLARDSASLVKAHSTKISLFIINEPFTPTAISKTLRELIQGPIPALGTAVQQCHADRYTRFIRRDLAWRCNRVLKELRFLLEKVPRNGKILTDEQKNGKKGPGAEKGSITTTGLLWGVCDEVVRFANMGVLGHLVDKVTQYHDTLKDVLQEIKQWAEELEDDDSGSGQDDGSALGSDDDRAYSLDVHVDDESNEHVRTQALLDNLMNSSVRIPRGDPDKIRERLDSSTRRLRLTILLTQAIIKRRMKTLPPLPAQATIGVISRIDEIMPFLRKLPDRFGELAGAFYELDSAEITRLMDMCFFDAFTISELLAKPWDGQKDEFTDWVAKFQIQIKKG